MGGALDFVRQMAGRASVLPPLYYAFFSTAFRREQGSLLAGFRAYEQSLSRVDAQSAALLRRNTHRVEKGLTMIPRREVFAVDYIQETVDRLKQIVQARDERPIDANSELHWARDVLAQYFELAGTHRNIDAARQQFSRLNVPSVVGAPELVPYHRDLTHPLSVAIDDLFVLARRRRSVRWFLDQPVPRQIIDRAMEVAAQSPSACNRQPFVFHVLDDRELVRQAAQIPMGTAGYDHNIPVLVVIVGQQRHYFDERDRHLIYIDGSLAAMSFVLALEAQGLSSCCINWPDIDDRERQMAALLKLQPDERPIMCIALGYPDPEGLVAYSHKKPLDQLRRYNFE